MVERHHFDAKLLRVPAFAPLGRRRLHVDGASRIFARAAVRIPEDPQWDEEVACGWRSFDATCPARSTSGTHFPQKQAFTVRLPGAVHCQATWQSGYAEGVVSDRKRIFDLATRRSTERVGIAVTARLHAH